MHRGLAKADFVLAAIATSLAVLTTGMGLLAPVIGVFFAVAIIAGTIVSSALHARLKATRFAEWSGLLYTASAVAVLFSVPRLNSLLPGEGFAADLYPAATMCWMLAFGSFLAWSEGVLLFQAVPCIALFGMVGCWDTYRGAPFGFFGFLLCMAAMMARAHGRAMLRQAFESGFTSMSRIRTGPWKWMAGPEWALASAAAIILVSLFGAPVIQMGMSSVAGSVKIALPSSIMRAQVASDSLATNGRGRVEVGTGPHHPGNAIVLRVLLDQPRYLRDNTYDSFEGHGWGRSGITSFPGDAVWQEGNVIHRDTHAQRVLKNPKRIDFQVEVVSGLFARLPSPGEVETLVTPRNYSPRAGEPVTRLASGSAIFNGTTKVANPDIVPKDALLDMPPSIREQLLSGSKSKRVSDFASSVAKGFKTDYEKALAIQRKITETCRYNLRAEAVPSDADAVDHFLFVSKEGYCDLFASAMVMMSRAIGIPARYATGYYPIAGERDNGRQYVIRASERHAWAELFFKDVGWVAFDATEGAVEVAGNGRGSSGDGPAWFEQAWVRTALDVAMGAVALTFMAFMLWGRHILASWFGVGAGLLGRETALSQTDARRKVGRLYAGLVRDVERACGQLKDPAWTPTEFLAATTAALGANGERFEKLTKTVVTHLYAPGQITAQEITSLGAGINEARRAIRQSGMSPWRARFAMLAAIPNEWLKAARTIIHIRREERRKPRK